MDYCYRIYQTITLKLDTVLDILYASKKYLMNSVSKESELYLMKNANSINIIKFLTKAIKLALNEIVEKLLKQLTNLIDSQNHKNKTICFELINCQNFVELPHDIINKYFVQSDSFYVKEEILFEKCVEYCKLHFKNYNHSMKNDKGIPNELNVDDEKLTLNVETEVTTQDLDSVRDKCKHDDNGISKLGRNWQSMMRSLFLFNIRLPLMSGKYFTEQVTKLDLLTKNEILDVMFQMVNGEYYRNVNKIIDTNAHNSGYLMHGKPIFSNNWRIVIKYQHYELKLSSKDTRTFYSQANTLTNKFISAGSGASTGSGTNQFIEAKFAGKTLVTQVELIPWQLQGRYHQLGQKLYLQYIHDITKDWRDIQNIYYVRDSDVTIIPTNNIQTTGIRILNTNGRVGLKYMQIKGAPLLF